MNKYSTLVVGAEGGELGSGLFEVESGREDFSLGAEDGCSDVGHEVDGCEGLSDLFEESGVHGVEGLRTVEGDSDDGSLLELLDL